MPAALPLVGSFFGVFRAAGDIRRAYGVRGLFQGHSATLIRIFPYAAIKFMAYEQIKHRIMPTKESQTAFRNMLAGSLAGICTVEIYTSYRCSYSNSARLHLGLLFIPVRFAASASSLRS